MSEQPRVVIRKLSTGVAGLDEVLGGGIPEYSFNLIAGAPGTGKTTLAQQIMFANATPERPGLFFSLLGEPPVKMLRYQQQFAFFDPGRVGRDVHFINLAEALLNREHDAALDRIVAELQRHNPSVVVVDSFASFARAMDGAESSEAEVQRFVQRLALQLTSWETTSFLIAEFSEHESRNPVFAVADGVIWMVNEVERNSSIRKLRVAKVRGQAALPGLHTVRIYGEGVAVFPRVVEFRMRPRQSRQRLSTGVKALDALMGGGIPSGDSIMVAGPTGSGKSILATQFIADGVARGECGVIAAFEEDPVAYIQRARSLGFPLDEMIAEGKLDIVYLRPIDLSVEDALDAIRQRIERLHADRVVVDSMSGFEVALAPGFRLDFREAYYRLLRALTALDITVLTTIEVMESGDYLRFAPFNVSFLADDILAMRYVELHGELRKVLSVIKMRSSPHSTELRRYELTAQGLEVGESLREYRGIITGIPAREV